MNLWRQGYTDTQIAKQLGCHPGSIKSWREARGLAANKGKKGDNYDSWGVMPGDRLRVKIRCGKGGSLSRMQRTGEVIAVYPRYMVVQLLKYRITVSRWELMDGTVKVEKLGQKAG